VDKHRLSRVLGLDYGERRIGLALSDPLGIIARPLTIIDRKKTKDYISRISEIISEKKITSIVVGLPLTLKGHNSKQTEIVLAFIDQLKSELQIPILSIDERLSSMAAKKSLQIQAVKTGHEKGRVDETAAAIFLQEYLDSKS
jgi:putative Holliday junction resolvase